MGGHKKYNGIFCQNTNAVSHKQAHIKHAFIEIDDTDSDKICLWVLATQRLSCCLARRFVSTGS